MPPTPKPSTLSGVDGLEHRVGGDAAERAGAPSAAAGVPATVEASSVDIPTTGPSGAAGVVKSAALVQVAAVAVPFVAMRRPPRASIATPLLWARSTPDRSWNPSK